MRLPVVWSDECLRHDPDAEVFVGVRMPAVEVAARVERIREALVAAGAPTVAAEPHGDEALLAVHDAALVEWLRGAWAEWELSGLCDDPGQNRVVPYNFMRRGVGARREPVATWARAGWFAYDTMTPIGPGTWEAARAAVDCALTAVDLVAAGEAAAYACVRPPGHHACRDGFGGACYLNNAAVAAEALRARLGGPVAVVDVDAHHAQRHPGALLRPRRRPSSPRFTSTPAPGGSRTSSASPTRREPAPASARTSTCRSPPAPATTSGSPRSPRGPAAPAAPAGSSSRSASTPPPATRRARSASARAATARRGGSSARSGCRP